MIQAAPLVISFARLVPALEKLVGAVGISTLTAKVNEHIEENPEESAMILKTLVPNLGIGEIFMKKGKDEKVEEEVDIEDMDPRDLTDAEKRKIMRDTAKSGGDVREKMKEAYEKFIKPGQDRTFEEAEERYEGGLEDVKKPPFDYKRFFRKADGGAIGVESLFEERTPFRFGGRGYQGGRNTGVSRGGGRSAAMGMGGKQRGGTFSAPTPTGGGGPRTPSGVTVTNKTKPQTYKYNVKPTIDRFQKGLFNKLSKLANLGKISDLEAEAISKTGLPSATGVISDARHLAAMNELSKSLSPFGGKVGEFIGDAGAFTAGLINEVPALGRGLSKENLDAIKEDIVANFGVFSTPQTTTAEQIYASKGLKKGGRVGFNVGGITDPAALSIYNSMNAYGFSDQEIADAITAQGYDAGTLGQTTTPDTPTAPTPGEGIIGIDLQQRDTGGGFNPFGPLQSTFTKDLSGIKGFEGLTPFEQMNKYKAQTQDNMFGLGRFFQPKIKGTLGNRLQKQFEFGQKLPSPLARIAGAQSPFNIDSKNYNPDFVDQLNYLELGDDLIGMSSVGLKYGSGSVLAGKNVISGFGTNNYQKALEKFIAKARGDRKIKAQTELDNFLAAEKARKEAERQQALTIAQAAQRSRDRDRIDRAYREETGGQAGSYGTGESGVQSDGSYNDPFDPGGGE